MYLVYKCCIVVGSNIVWIMCVCNNYVYKVSNHHRHNLFKCWICSSFLCLCLLAHFYTLVLITCDFGNDIKYHLVIIITSTMSALKLSMTV